MIFELGEIVKKFGVQEGEEGVIVKIGYEPNTNLRANSYFVDFGTYSQWRSEASIELVGKPLVTRKKKPDGTVAGTFNSNCPSCKAYRVHTKEDWKEYHPLAGQAHAVHHVQIGLDQVLGVRVVPIVVEQELIGKYAIDVRIIIHAELRGGYRFRHQVAITSMAAVRVIDSFLIIFDAFVFICADSASFALHMAMTK